MIEHSTQPELTGLERFGHLEDKIFRVVEAFRTIRKENETLQAENQRLRGEIDILQQSATGYNETLAQLQRERESLKERVEKALSLLATLEVR